MPNRFLSLATVAMTPDLDPEVSRRRLAEFVRRIKDECPDVRLILFGETILGWFYNDGETKAYHDRIAETIPGPSTQFVAELTRAHDVYISFGLSEKRDGKLHNAQVLIDPKGEIRAVHRKFHIRNPIFQPGEPKLTTADVDGTKVAILICADARSFRLLRAIRRARPAVVLASLADYGTSLRLNRMMGAFYDAWTVVANRYGEEPPLTWHGLITITDPFSRMRAHAMGKEQYLCQRIRIARSGLVRRKLRRLFVAGKLLTLGAGYVHERVIKKLCAR